MHFLRKKGSKILRMLLWNRKHRLWLLSTRSLRKDLTTYFNPMTTKRGNKPTLVIEETRWRRITIIMTIVKYPRLSTKRCYMLNDYPLNYKFNNNNEKGKKVAAYCHGDTTWESRWKGWRWKCEREAYDQSKAIQSSHGNDQQTKSEQWNKHNSAQLRHDHAPR